MGSGQPGHHITTAAATTATTKANANTVITTISPHSTAADWAHHASAHQEVRNNLQALAHAIFNLHYTR